MSTEQRNADEDTLASLGYKQELARTWSAFSNFAISFSIISILAGCFTTFFQAWNNGGPVAISLGWPLVSIFILIIGFCMSELVSAYPTSGGIYWWASKLGGAKAGYYTGWLNLTGLVAILASVAYGAASFVNVFLGLLFDGWGGWFMGGDFILQQFVLFVVVLALVVAINVFSSHLLAIINNISVWWHVAGAAIVILILIFGVDAHQSADFVFTGKNNNSGFGGDSGLPFWFYVIPLGFLLTQYTITGFDASAHLSEETHGAAQGAARGIWQSILYSAIGGYILLLAFLFAAKDTDFINALPPDNPWGQGSIFAVLDSALSDPLFTLVVFISAAGQIYCSTACLTAASRMVYAFSRDGAVPGSGYLRRVNPKGVPVHAVVASAVVALILTLPALYKNPTTQQPTAFLAVVSIGVIGLYVCFAIPIWLRWRAGDSFTPGPWTLGKKYKWMNLVAVIEIAIVSVYFMLPFASVGTPGKEGFAWPFFNYAPIVFGVLLLSLWVAWHLSVKHWFTGPKSTIDDPDVHTLSES